MAPSHPSTLISSVNATTAAGSALPQHPSMLAIPISPSYLHPASVSGTAKKMHPHPTGLALPTSNSHSGSSTPIISTGNLASPRGSLSVLASPSSTTGSNGTLSIPYQPLDAWMGPHGSSIPHNQGGIPPAPLLPSSSISAMYSAPPPPHLSNMASYTIPNGSSSDLEPASIYKGAVAGNHIGGYDSLKKTNVVKKLDDCRDEEYEDDKLARKEQRAKDVEERLKRLDQGLYDTKDKTYAELMASIQQELRELNSGEHPDFQKKLVSFEQERDLFVYSAQLQLEYHLECAQLQFESDKEAALEEYKEGRETLGSKLLEVLDERRRKITEDRENFDINAVDNNSEFVRATRKSARQHASKIMDGLEPGGRTTKQPKKKNFVGPNMLLTINEITEDIATIRRMTNSKVRLSARNEGKK
ncbi:hypothetical protein SeMB42_g05934 [Synchytrium endobioticum]|nr:hypothetical protein SeMB42_g05934 [Synchytrium endobioticum]